MEESLNITEALKENNYFLVTNREGKEMYDEDGNLLLFQAESRNCLAVPNTEEVRKLYELPLETPDIKDTLKKGDVYNNAKLYYIPSESNQMVWMGHGGGDHNIRATKALIELFKSPRYQQLMNDRNTVKSQVWEMMAAELQEKGFKIADNNRDAGLRAFQKWRNMERTYWKHLRLLKDEPGEDSNRQKPFYFDDLDAIMKKRRKTQTNPEENNCSNVEAEVKGIETELDVIVDEGEIVQSKKNPTEAPVSEKDPNIQVLSKEAFPCQALTLLTSLVTSSKYESTLKDPSYANRMKAWKSIYSTMRNAGWKFGNTIREGALLLSRKWRMVEKTILRKRLLGPRTLYTPTFRKALLMEIEKRKASGEDLSISDDPPAPPDIVQRKLKDGELEPEAVEALLTIMNFDHNLDSLTSEGGKKVIIWERIYDDFKAMGYNVAGLTKRAKVSKLFQKWRNLKRGFVKYHVEKFRGRETKKPVYYDLLFKIISRDVLKMDNTESVSYDEMVNEDDDEEEPEEEGENDLYPPDTLNVSKDDHDYGQTGVSNCSEFGMVHKPTVEQENMKHKVQLNSLALNSKCSTTQVSRSYKVLEQIKSLHETALASHQANFSKLFSLLEEQINQQKLLTTMISEYIINNPKKSTLRNGHKAEEASPQKRKRVRRMSVVGDKDLPS